MPRSRRARLSTAGLAAAALLAPALVAAPASAAVSPYSSCAEVQLGTPTVLDGEYQITVFGQTLDVYCADMAGLAPTEYLTLPRTGGAYNFSQDSYDVTVTTHFTRVRLTLPASSAGTFSINPDDTRFATSDIGANRTWGYTGSCAFRTSALNDANLDLTGTPFAMSASNLVWTGGGTVNQSGPQVIDIIDAGGNCGGIRAVNPFPLTWLGPVAPVVTDPADVTVASGGDAVFTASATGDPTITVQWQWSADGITWTDIDGATSTELTLIDVTTEDAGEVRAVFTNAEGSQPTGAATLTVTPLAPSVTDPSDVTVTSGEDATFTVEVSGDPAPTVQWQWSVDGTTWTTIDGATSTDLVLGDVTTEDDAVMVRAVVTSTAGTDTSEPATLTVRAAAPVITTAPTATTVDAGQDATFSVTATGDPTPTYQWQTSLDNLVWTDVAGATGTTLTLDDVTAAQDGLWVRVFIANDGGATASDGVRLTVISPAVVPPAPAAPGAPGAVRAALPVTGSDALQLLAVASTLLVAGASGLILARRRTTTG